MQHAIICKHLPINHTNSNLSSPSLALSLVVHIEWLKVCWTAAFWSVWSHWALKYSTWIWSERYRWERVSRKFVYVCVLIIHIVLSMSYNTTLTLFLFLSLTCLQWIALLRWLFLSFPSQAHCCCWCLCLYVSECEYLECVRHTFDSLSSRIHKCVCASVYTAYVPWIYTQCWVFAEFGLSRAHSIHTHRALEQIDNKPREHGVSMISGIEAVTCVHQKSLIFFSFIWKRKRVIWKISVE